MTGLASAPATMLDKIWARHLIQSRPDGQDLMFIDRHFIHDVTAPACELLRARKLKPRAPQRTFGVPEEDFLQAAADHEPVLRRELRDDLRVTWPTFRLLRAIAGSPCPGSNCPIWIVQMAQKSQHLGER